MTSELVKLRDDGEAVTTSLLVAERFGKQHKDVLKAIKNLECSEEFSRRNFAHTPYKHPQNGQTYHVYELTKDGFSFLALGFTGAKAAEFKEAFITAFNQMQALTHDKAWIIDRAMKYLTEDNQLLKQQLAIKDESLTEVQKDLKDVQLKLTHYQDVIDSDDPITATVIAKELGMSAVTLNKILAELGIIHKCGASWVPFAKYQAKKITVYKTVVYLEKGEVHTIQLLCWNQEGRRFIHELIKNYRVSGDIQAAKN